MTECYVGLTPFFTVVIPVFNRVAELDRSVRSVLAQSFPDFECIVVDDGSDPDFCSSIRSVVAKLDDPRVSLVVNSLHVNGSVARNTGILRARGRYVAFLDSDDEWLPSKLERVRQFLILAKFPGFVYHRYRNCGYGSLSPEIPTIGIATGQSAADYSFRTNRYGGIQTSCIVVDSSLAKAVRFDPRLPAHQDWEFVIRLQAQHRHLEFLPETLTTRHVSALGGAMVSRSISHDFSLEFLKGMLPCFSLAARVAYARNILIERYFREVPAATWSFYHTLAFVLYPISCFGSWYRWMRIRQRLRELSLKLDRANARTIALIGFNMYSQTFKRLYSRSYNRVILIDRKANSNETSIRRLVDLQNHEITSIDAFALMTDRHRRSMLEDLLSKDIPVSKIFSL